MRRICSVLTLVTFLFSCNGGGDKKAETLAPPTAPAVLDTVAGKTDSHYLWSAEVGNKGGLVMQKSTPLSADSLNVPNILKVMNELYPEVKLEYEKVAGDTVFLRIRKSTYLSQQMGSSGAESYLAEVTYNLTEVPNINFVDVRFKEGDHATPGTYSRTDFVHGN